MANVLCIYHKNCADGLGSAWAVHRALGSNVEFLAAAYGDAPPIAAAYGRNVLIVDFSYPLETLRALAQSARSVLVLDHHKSAQADLARIPPTCTSYSNFIKYGQDIGIGVTNLCALFDMERSGAGLTSDYLASDMTFNQNYLPVRSLRSHIIDLIEDRDLWCFRYGEETRAFHAVLTSFNNTDLPAALKRLDEWSTNYGQEAQGWDAALNEGRAILRYESALVAGIVRGTRRTMQIAGAVVPVACAPGQLASEAGNLMCQPSFRSAIYPGGEIIEADYETIQIGNIPSNTPSFSATYYDGADGLRHFSLRSPEGCADVGAIAKLYGGGGHEHASGFTMPTGWEGE